MKNTTVQNGIIEAPVEVEKIRNIYGWISTIYFLAAPLEKKARMRGIELAGIQPDDTVLEVAVGIGHSFLEILKRVDPKNIVNGVDLTPQMLEKTKRLAESRGYSNFKLQESDARRLPFPNETFDVLYNSYMMDLIPLSDLPFVTQEFHRVLKKDGRLVLINLSKKDHKAVFYEGVYNRIPYLLGGCRPVLMASFMNEAHFKGVKREILPLFPSVVSEIVIGIK